MNPVFSLIREHLQRYRLPQLPKAVLAPVQWLEGSELENGSLQITLGLGFPFASQRALYESSLQAFLQPLVEQPLAVRLQQKIQPHVTQQPAPTARISNIVLVSSGKGGVGKSTTAVNLALALHREGARVGILDADIFGPSVPLLLGMDTEQKPQIADQKYFIPIMAHGLQALSMGNVVSAATPVVFRGPKASGAVVQMLEQTQWDDLDYLLVDMPPGTGDIALTVAQKLPVAGAVIVTTPQDVALLDTVKGIEMFRKANIKVLGIVENMALHQCSQCGHIEHVFGAGGGEAMATRYAVPLLGSLPLSLAVRLNADAGTPVVVSAPQSPEALAYMAIARAAAAQLSAQPVTRRAFPPVSTEP